MSNVRAITLAELVLPRSGALQDAALILGASVVTGLVAQVAIPLPWTPVPITGQTFAVLLCGAALGARRGLMAQLLYLAEGAAGLPVFAGGAGGAHVFLGPTAGYLLSFPLAAAVTGALAERGWDRKFWSMLACMLLGSTVIFAGGLAGLARFLPLQGLLQSGLLPFVPGDLIKAALAATAFPATWKLANRQ